MLSYHRRNSIFSSIYFHVFYFLVFSTLGNNCVGAAPEEMELQEYLLNQRLSTVRPVRNYSDSLYVLLRFTLTQIAELSLKEQVLTVNMKIHQEWSDYKLTWNPDNYGGITQIQLFSDKIWKPDIYLYNNFVEFEIKSSFVLVHFTGLVTWQPMAIAKSFCQIQVRHYPFDFQTCNLTFGSWTYGNALLRMAFKDKPEEDEELAVGMDLSEYCPSTEWDLISIPGRYETLIFEDDNTTKKSNYSLLRFGITLRRRYFFYLFNLVVPLIGLSYLSLLVFYLPADSGEKITLCMSLLTSQVTFLLLMIDNIPVTSLAVPLLGKMIIFNLLLIFCSISCTIIVLNVHHRKPSTHKLPKWVERLRGRTRLLKVLLLEHPEEKPKNAIFPEGKESSSGGKPGAISNLVSSLNIISAGNLDNFSWLGQRTAVENVCYIRNYIACQKEEEAECHHWKLLSMIIDRIFLIVFHVVYICCMVVILSGAAAMYDHSQPVDVTNVSTDIHFPRVNTNKQA